MRKIILTFAILINITLVSFAQNVGIGTTTPDKAKLVVRGSVGAVNAMFGDNVTGVAIESSFPGVAFNSYYSGSRKSISNGFGGLIGMDPINGFFHIYTSDTAGIAGNAIGTKLRMLINKDGNVGIQGNASPISPLSLASTTGNKISLWGTDPLAHYGFGIQSNLFQSYTSSAGADIAFGFGSSTNFTENMRIKGTGNVGIGTSAPDKARFVVRGSIGAVNAMFGDNVTGVAIESNYPGVAFNTYYSGSRKSISNGFGGVVSMDPTNGDFKISSSDTSGIAGSTIGTNLRMLINKNGFIGLQGNGDPTAPLSFASSPGNKILLWGADPNAHYGMGIQGNLLQNYTSWSGADIAFGYGSSTNFSETMRIKGTGNVGIGTSTPDKAQLVVRGSVGSVNAMFGDNTSGVAIESNDPGIGFNSYMDGGRKSIANGYGAVVGFNHSNGDFSIKSSDVSGTAGNTLATSLRLMIRNNGKVGIGTATPGAKLEVSNNTFGVLQLTNTSALAAGTLNDMTFRTGNFTTGTIYTVGTSASTARMGFGTGSFLTERLSIAHDGKVGINTTTPTSTLEVNGTSYLRPDAGSQTAAIVDGRMRFYGSAFQVDATGSSLSADGKIITIDNPICNGNSGLMLMVTCTGPNPIPYYVYYDNGLHKWTICAKPGKETKKQGLAVFDFKLCNGGCYEHQIPTVNEVPYTFDFGTSFNVLVIEY